MVVVVLCSGAFAGPRVEVRDGWFFVDGEKFFVKGIGYELGSRPGQIPWDRPFQPEHIRHDLRMIRDAGFNTLRTWAPMTPPELDIVREYGLMVIQGVWFDWEKYLVDEASRPEIDSGILRTVESSRRFDNILCYTILNEPDNRKVMRLGPRNFSEMCDHVRTLVRTADPGRPVSFSPAAYNTFIDMSGMDLLLMNAYMYAPSTIRHAMGYENYLEWTKKRCMPDKPFVVGEFGLSVSPKGEGRFRYGGNTHEDQREGDIYMFQSILAAGLQGGCLFMWNDGWWKAGDKLVHDDHAEEWYGVIGMEDLDDWKGRPRPVYESFKEINQAIVLSPRRAAVYAGEIPVEVYAETAVTNAMFSLDGKTWTDLVKTGTHGWTGVAGAVQRADGKYKMYLKIEGFADGPAMRDVEFWISRAERFLPELRVMTDKDTYVSGDELTVTMTLRDADGAPLSGQTVFYTIENMVTNAEQNLEGRTGPDGTLRKKTRLIGGDAFVTVGCGFDFEKDGLTRRISDARIVELKSGMAGYEGRIKEWERTAAPGAYFHDFEVSSEDDIRRRFPRIMAGDGAYHVRAETDVVRKGQRALRLEFDPASPSSWGYCEEIFADTKDISGAEGLGVWIHGDRSGNELKIMLIDEDGERWYGGPVRIDFRGWKKHVFVLKMLLRDPYDGVTGGNESPDFARVRGVAMVMTAGARDRSTVIMDDMETYR